MKLSGKVRQGQGRARRHLVRTFPIHSWQEMRAETRPGLAPSEDGQRDTPPWPAEDQSR